MKRNNQNDEAGANQNKKINIFEQQNSTMLKKENLASLGYVDNTRALVPSGKNDDNKSTISKTSSRMTQLDPLMHKPKAIEYLKKGAEGKETVRDFISFGRKILMS